jgi:HlyD family secretion protein
MKETKYYFKGIISKSDWDKSIALKLRKRVKSLAYFSVKSASASVNEARDNLGEL